jgi:hypothetical protein
MAATARNLGALAPDGERVFMATAAWMFIYTIAEDGGRPVFREYDLNFKSSRTFPSLSGVFEGWWEIVLADLE